MIVLGRIRLIAQTISYQKRLVLILIFFSFTYRIIDFSKYQLYIWLKLVIYSLKIGNLSFILYLYTVYLLAENNPSHFDLAQVSK